MEDPAVAVVEEEEDFYERIEAPKFVDFTIPDSSRPDHSSWFCVRIGCDQNHEEIDPDELNRSFMLRVMSARSPNVRFQRALNKQNSRANTKCCPQSAPAKSIKNGISRIITMNSITEKITMAKLKQHPIGSLRDIPIQKKAKGHTLTSEKEQNTTSNNKSQAKCLKVSDTAVASKDRSLVKDLFSHTPKKAARSCKAPISEICSEMKKINIGGDRKCMPQGSSISLKKSSAVSSKHRNRSILKEAKHYEMRDVRIGVGSNCLDHIVENNSNLVKSTGEEHQAIINSKIGSDSGVSIKPGKDEVQHIDLKISSGAGIEIKSDAMNDDDKENNLFTFENKNLHPNAATSETKSLQFANSNPQEAKAQNKAFQGLKLKRTTNPKPFRLRTDERGILKEANLERKLQGESKKEPAIQNPKGGQREDKNCPHQDASFKKINKASINIPRKISEEALRKQETISQAKLAKSTQTYKQLNSKKEKKIQGSHSKSFKIASPKKILKLTSAAKARRNSTSRMFKEKGGLIKLPDRTAERSAGCLQGRKPATIPKEPKFHRIHVPKNCIRRYQMAVS